MAEVRIFGRNVSHVAWFKLTSQGYKKQYKKEKDVFWCRQETIEEEKKTLSY